MSRPLPEHKALVGSYRPRCNRRISDHVLRSRVCAKNIVRVVVENMESKEEEESTCDILSIRTAPADRIHPLVINSAHKAASHRRDRTQAITIEVY